MVNKTDLLLTDYYSDIMDAKIILRRSGLQWQLHDENVGGCVQNKHTRPVEVFNFMLSFIENHDLNVKAILYDQWGAGTFVRRLDEVKNDYLIIPVRQGINSLNEPTKFLQNAFIKGQITMFDDEAMFGALSNAVIVEDNNGIKIDKNTNSANIDIADAVVNALYGGRFHFTEFTNAPDDKSSSPFVGMSSDDKIEF